MNGSEMGQRTQSAREMTAEIDRATDVAANQQLKVQEGVSGREIGRSQAGNFGNKVLTYNPDAQAELNNERVHEMAEIDNGYGADGADNANVVGEESRLQSAERLAEDREDVANEQGLNGNYVKNIMDRNNKRITAETVAAVDKLISDNEYRPGQLDQLMSTARTKFLKDVFNRILGSRNA